MSKQNEDEKNGQVKVTKGYALPSKYVFHTVGPIVGYKVTKQNKIDLTNCYLSCLKKADEMNLKTIVFCSISTGVYSFPITQAAKIAINTTIKYLKNSKIEKVVFDLFSSDDYEVYDRTIKEIN